MTQIKTYILDDDSDAISRLGILLEEVESLKVCGSETNPQKAIPIILSHQPDLIFLDIEMPGYSGFDVLEHIRSKQYQPTIIFVTAYDRYAIEAIKASAFDYLLKPVDPKELTQTLGKYDMLNGTKNKYLDPDLEKLTTREYEIFNLLRLGQSSKQIADTLHISKNTVDTHRRHILKKLSLSSTTEIHLNFRLS